MLQFTKSKEFIDGSIKYESTNACNGIVEIYKYANNSYLAIIEFFGNDPKQINGTNSFKKEFFDDFETAKNWAETQICQEVTITKIEANKLGL